MFNNLYLILSSESAKRSSWLEIRLRMLELLNGSGDISNLTEATSELEALGFEVVQSGNTSTTGNTTIIERNNMGVLVEYLL